jgi:spoIIIJ-associated protein
MDFIEVDGKTYEDAVKKACHALNAEETDLDIDVTEVDTKGILGLLGGKKVRITARLRSQQKAPESGITKNGQPSDPLSTTPEQYGIMFLQELGHHLSISFRVRVAKQDNRLLFHVESDGADVLVGKDGEALEATQYLLKLAMAKRFKQGHKITIDIDGYREQRKKTLTIMAKRLSDKAKKSRKSIKTKPLNPYERRIIHTLFKNDRGVTTKSEGEGHTKQVIISPTGNVRGRR